jgi:hypothetical protein
MEKEILEFIEAVAEMRKLQQSFYGSVYGTVERSNFLNYSKAKEKQVDAMIKELSSGQTKLL